MKTNHDDPNEMGYRRVTILFTIIIYILITLLELLIILIYIYLNDKNMT